MYNKNNIFAQIIREEITSKKVYEDDFILAFHDAAPAAPIHVLVVPKGEYKDYADFTENASKEYVAHYFIKISEIASGLGLDETGFRLVSNKGATSGQTVSHFHTHILSGAKFGNVI